VKPKSRNIQSIIEYQVNSWFIKKKGRPKGKETKKPLILISRQRGAGGLSVAEILSQKLGWPYYDKNIIKEIATAIGADEKQLAFLDEQDRDVFKEFVNVFSREPDVSQEEYVQYLKRFIKTLHEVGASIVVGRGAEYILPPQEVLRTRLVGEPEARARFAAQKYGVDEREAGKLLKTSDEERRKFIKRYFEKDIDNPAHHDLVINTGGFALDAVAELIIVAYKLKFPGVLS
jgi:cytidylate kinase